MKNKYYIFVALLATTITGILPAMAQNSGPVTDSVVLGPTPGYSNEVYYNMSTGIQSTVLRTQWDIAFRTAILSASIITNDGAGVVLYTYPKADTSGWSTVDTSGISIWQPLYNSITDWEAGAFNTHTSSQYDYGWGVYNIATHNLTGDSLYIIKLRNGQFGKIWIVQKASSLNKYTIRYAGLDGQNENTVTVNCSSYTSRNFLGFSIPENKVVDFEAVDASTWDILFTRYKGLSGTTRYNVVGVLSNYNTGVNMHHPVSPDFMGWDVALMDSTRAAIGSDWKAFTNSTYEVVDSMVYFVQDKTGNIHKLVFKEFNWNTTGSIVFEKEMISAAGTNDLEKSDFNAVIYPNPVIERMNLVINPENGNSVEVTLLDMAGRTAFNRQFDLPSHVLSTVQIPVSDIPSGVYVVKIQVGKKIISRKVIINN